MSTISDVLKELSVDNAPFVGRLGVAVSGGSDSMGLLHLLLAAGWPKEHLCVLHVNHGLRESAIDEQQLVETHCENLGIHYHVETLDIEKDTATPQTLREHRLNLFQRCCMQFRLGAIALAHNADDQRETRWFALIRGSGLRGLAGMRVWNAPFWRPLLGLRRQEIRAFLVERKIDWREDPTNYDLRYPRTRLRHHILPAIARPLTDSEHIRSTMLHEEADYLDTAAQKAYGKVVQVDQIRLESFSTLHPAIQRRLLVRWLPNTQPLERIETLRETMITRADRTRFLEMQGGWAVVVGAHNAVHTYSLQAKNIACENGPRLIRWGNLGTLVLTPTRPSKVEFQTMALADLAKQTLEDYTWQQEKPHIHYAEQRFIWPCIVGPRDQIWSPHTLTDVERGQIDNVRITWQPGISRTLGLV